MHMRAGSGLLRKTGKQGRFRSEGILSERGGSLAEGEEGREESRAGGQETFGLRKSSRYDY